MESRHTPESEFVGTGPGSIQHLAFSPDGTKLASAGYDFNVRLWDVKTGTLLPQPEGHFNFVQFVKLIGDEKTLLTGGSDGLIYEWEVATGKAIRHFQGYQIRGKAVALSPDQKVLISGDKDGAIHFWNLAAAKEIRQKFVARPSPCAW